ncbi:MAG: helix-turn-helix domain-containing protein [Enterococcus lacertideformus]|uniref:Helix-turn-helix domain-containing protein n=1 Tax=Enterococcus lacertideformus TaxID=2771493 RepID=A0A931B0Y8_9ENTE|nr:helix-turn-helix domain-containing protein [Enterococcus lacertideformus]
MEQKMKKRQIQFLNTHFLSTKESIEYLNVSQQTFYKLVKEEKLTKIDKEGVILYFKKEIKKLKERRNN